MPQENKNILVIEDAAISASIQQGATAIGTEGGDVPVTAFDLVLERNPEGGYRAIKCNFAYPESINVAGIANNSPSVPADIEPAVPDEFTPKTLIHMVNGMVIAACEVIDELRSAWDMAHRVDELLGVTSLVTLHQGQPEESKLWEQIPVNPEHVMFMAAYRP